jgi:DNA-binding winged helix-turn-helix (wHTH) protein
VQDVGSGATAGIVTVRGVGYKIAPEDV